MGSFSIWHWIIVLVVVLVLFGGRGKLSSLMGDMAKGITAFRKGLKDGESGDPDAPKTISTAGGPQAANPPPSPADGIRRDEAVKN